MRAKRLVVLYSCCNELQRVEHGVERMADERVSRVIEWSHWSDDESVEI